MAEVSSLLDTPKRKSLQSQSVDIRAALKDFERTFAIENQGRKPSKDDIKANGDVAAKYKQYNRIRDVLSGKLEYEVFAAPSKPVTRKQAHKRNDSGTSWTPRKKHHDATPRKTCSPGQDDTLSPNPVLFHAIGPTPQRDGKVLGLFDLLTDSAHSSKATPSAAKRKLETLIAEDPHEVEHPVTAETPSRKKACAGGDLLDYLSGTPQTGRRKHSRTPVSEGRKFMLSQFFATPSTARYADVDTAELEEKENTRRDHTFGMTPENRIRTHQEPADATPAYLRRSTSFKDRLLSVSQSRGTQAGAFMSPPPSRNGPPTLRHLRSAPQLLNRLGLQSVNHRDPADAGVDADDVPDDDEFEDELEALREIEDDVQGEAYSTAQPTHPRKSWKKRGQKRTTRRAIMRPTQGRMTQAPQFVSADGDDEEEDGGFDAENDHVPIHDIGGKGGSDYDDDDEDENDDEDRLARDESSDFKKKKTKEKRKKEKDTSTNTTKSSRGQEKTKTKTTTINPNAVSHMNFRSLKIKNKNSKAKKGGGRFRSGRR